MILSGDVHYSFVYQVLIRHRNGGPKIWQITSSGIKNEFQSGQQGFPSRKSLPTLKS